MVMIITTRHEKVRFTDTLQSLGLAKNEALIYETLVKHGQLSVSVLAVKAGIHRRNVYDTVARLIDKGLIYEVLGETENIYCAVDPSKLREMLAEKEELLDRQLPALAELYAQNPIDSAVYLLKGKEGWKQVMRDILRLKADVHTIAANGGWNERNLGGFFEQFKKQAAAAEINFYILYDTVARKEQSVFKQFVTAHRFLPSAYLTDSAIDIFADRVVINANIKSDATADEDISIMIINQTIADSYRKWWQFMWDHCPKPDK